MDDKFRKLVADISNAIQKNGVSIGMALAAMDRIKDLFHCSTALSDCKISDDGVVVNMKEGEKK